MMEAQLVHKTSAGGGASTPPSKSPFTTSTQDTIIRPKDTIGKTDS